MNDRFRRPAALAVLLAFVAALAIAGFHRHADEDGDEGDCGICAFHHAPILDVAPPAVPTADDVVVATAESAPRHATVAPTIRLDRARAPPTVS